MKIPMLFAVNVIHFSGVWNGAENRPLLCRCRFSAPFQALIAKRIDIDRKQQ